jgi:transcriptional regulator with XRE-family HTH domain
MPYGDTKMVFGRKREEDKYNRYIREKVREARLERGMTQDQLAKLIYKSQKTMSDIESGRTEIGAVDLIYIAHVLEKSIAFFNPIHQRTEGDLTSDQWELIHFFSDIGEPKLERLIIKQAQEYANLSIAEDLKEDRRQSQEAREALREEKKKAKQR